MAVQNIRFEISASFVLDKDRVIFESTIPGMPEITGREWLALPESEDDSPEGPYRDDYVMSDYQQAIATAAYSECDDYRIEVCDE